MAESDYWAYSDVKKNIGDGYKECYDNWFAGQEQAFDYLDQYEEEEELELSNPSSFDDIKALITDIVKSIKFFCRHIDLKKKRSLRILCGKVIAYSLFANRIKIRKNDLLYLLDFVDWNFNVLFVYADEWASCEEQAGYDIIKLMDVANECGKKISGYRRSCTIYALLAAVLHNYYDTAANFIISKKIKLTKRLLNEQDALINDAVIYFRKEYAYELK